MIIGWGFLLDHWGFPCVSGKWFVAILGQVWYDNRMGISLESLGISLCFRGVIYDDPRTGLV